MKYIFIIALAVCMLSFFRSITIIGKVTDSQGLPVTGASIQVKGTTSGTVTDTAGNFSITVPSENTILLISALGFKTREVKVSVNNLTITLTPSLQELSEVIIPASPIYSLQGRASGISASSINKVRIRGYSSLSNESKSKYDIEEDDKVYDNSAPRLNSDFNTEGYDKIEDNPFLKVNDNPLSTFSIDVDAASYSNVRRFINDNELPPAGAVRIEELINYFHYNYPQPAADEPFSVNTELSACPWNTKHQLALIGLQGKIIPAENLPASNLVFLVDVSGSMMDENKLPLVQQSLKLLVDQLRKQDKVSLVVYAGSAGVVLPSTSGDEKIKIKDAINALEAGGSTAGGEGIKLAYKIAKQNFVKGGNNRLILCTDGDFNVGISSDDELETLIENERKSGVFLTVLGYGMGNYQDAKMQKLADKGNGNHAYVDGLSEAKKVLIHEFGGTLFTIAKDVKLQVEFNPEKVKGYRLIGYENRLLAKEDFNNDAKDAGDLGSGHAVTALYEIIPQGVAATELDSVDALHYQKTKTKYVPSFDGEIMNIKLRYKQPDGDVSKLLQHPVKNDNVAVNSTTDNFRFAAAVAEFGMLLRDSKYKGNGSFAAAEQLAKQALGNDAEGYRKEFLKLIKNAAALKANKETADIE